MNLRPGLRQYLYGLPSIRGLVGARLHSEVVLSDEFPYVTFERTSQGPDHHLNSATGLTSSSWRFDIFSLNIRTAELIGEALRSGLDGLKHTTMRDVDVRWVGMTDQRDDFIPATDGSEPGIFTISQDYDIWHRESVPVFPAV